MSAGEVVDIFVISDGPVSDVRSLETWLAENRSVRGTVELADNGTGPDAMGGAGEFVRLLLEPGGVMAAAVTAAGAWLVTRSAGTRLRLRKGDVEVEVVARPGQDAEEIAKRAMDSLTPVRGDGDGHPAR